MTDEQWEDAKMLSCYQDEHQKWLKPKIAWLRTKNKNYAEAIENEEARPPYKWSFEFWYKERLARENAPRSSDFNDNSPF